MTTEMKFSVPLANQLTELLTQTKQSLNKLKCGADLTAIANIQNAKISINSLMGQCAKVDNQARPQIETLVKKLQKKLEFGERLGQFLSQKPETLDPRVEKIVGNIQQKTVPNHMQELSHWQTKLSQWQQKLDQIGVEKPNALTARTVEEAKSMLRGRSLIGELKKEALAGKPLTEYAPHSTTCSTETTLHETPITMRIVESSTQAFAIEPIPREQMSAFILHFQKIIEALSQGSEEVFFQAVASAAGCTITSDQEEKEVLHQIVSHLYCIQNKETPEKIDRMDRLWGASALLSNQHSTVNQRVRAAQRAQVETLLKLLRLALEREDNDQVGRLLDVLERLELNPSDLPGYTKNVAHQLFGKLFAVHVDTRKTGVPLEDAYDQKFGADFGRRAFRGETDAAPTSLKIQAIQEVNQDFKCWWGI